VLRPQIFRNFDAHEALSIQLENLDKGALLEDHTENFEFGGFEDNGGVYYLWRQ
jgi:hypothetical protein